MKTRRKNITYEFVPQQMTVGMFNGNAFVTCRYKYDKWLNVSMFERLCGYKPHSQRDPEKMLKKNIFNAVETIDNTPISGFSFVDFNKDLYGLYYNSYDCTDVVLQDPRGFNVAVTAENFWYMLRCAGMNMKDGEIIDHKFAYAWSSGASRFLIVDAESDTFTHCLSESCKHKADIDSTKYMTASQLEVGKVYKTTDDHEVVYLGKHDTYSDLCHLEAYDNKGYLKSSIDKFCHDRTDLTGIDKHVFFVLGVKINKYCGYEIPGISYGTDCNPYVAKKSVSKYILKKLPDNTMSKYKMYNTDVAVTYDKIIDDMQHSLFFNKLDFAKSDKSYEKLDLEHFISEYGYDDRHVCASFPFMKWDRAKCIYADTNSYGNFKTVEINAYEASAGRHDYVIRNGDDSYSYSYYNSRNENRHNNITVEELYDIVQPYVKTFYLENGNKVDQFAARCFMPSAQRKRW